MPESAATPGASKGDATQEAAKAGKRGQPFLSGWWFLAVGFGLASVLILVLTLGAGAALDPATVGLAVALIALLYALRSLFRLVSAIAQPQADAIVLGERRATPEFAELRDERKRVMRAIKELEFDFEMGKLEQADYDEVLRRYKVRAIELSRVLDGGALHPDVVALLDPKAEANA